MSWDPKRPDGPRYYYRSVRVGGRVRKVYVGQGPRAERQAQRDEQGRVLRLAARAAAEAVRERVADALLTLKDLRTYADALARATLLGAGVRYHRGEWRRIPTVREDEMTETLTPEAPSDVPAAVPPLRPTRPATRTPPVARPVSRVVPPPPGEVPVELPLDSYVPPPPGEHPNHEPKRPSGVAPEPKPVRPAVSQKAALQIVIARANAGNETCLQGLREQLDAEPDLWREAGDLARYAEAQWTEVAAAGNVFVREAAKRYLAALKVDLLGPSPTRLEELLVAQVGVTYLAAQYGELAAAKPAQGRQGPEAVFRLKQAESAQKRHLAAMKTLAAVRAMSRQV